jgi:CheY-like chemotaxis protein
MKKIVFAKGFQDLLPEKGSFLDRTDVKVLTAATNDELRRICAQEEVDLIVTKLDLPGIRSEELFSFIRNSERSKKASIIIIGEDTLAHRERCKQCRANAVLTTPVDADVLLIKMQQFLNVAPRMLYRTSLAVAIEGKFKDRPLPFWTENISESGMLIRAEEALAKGSGVFLSFFLPDGTHISGYGEIVRIDRLPAVSDLFLYGIKFTNIEPAAQSAIESVVKLTRRKNAQRKNA